MWTTWDTLLGNILLHKSIANLEEERFETRLDGRIGQASSRGIEDNPTCQSSALSSTKSDNIGLAVIVNT